MRKILISVLLLMRFIPVVSAETYIVINVNDDQVIEAYHEHDVQSIASITKIMTALVALEKGDYTDCWIVGEEVLEASGSSIYLKKGQQVSMRSLLYGLMLRSGNDAALVIAKRVGGNEEKFVKMMNSRAQEIGMRDTIFHNPHGLDVEEEGNYSSAYDMALLMKEALLNPTFREIVSTEYYESEWGEKWHNANELLIDFPFCIGGKTGFTNKAGRTFVSAAEKDKAQYIIVTLNLQDRFEFHQEKYEEIMNEREVIELVSPQTFELEGYKISIEQPFEVVATKEELEKGELLCNLNKEKQEYEIEWYSGEHKKMRSYPAKKKFCFWGWCFE